MFQQWLRPRAEATLLTVDTIDVLLVSPGDEPEPTLARALAEAEDDTVRIRRAADVGEAVALLSADGVDALLFDLAAARGDGLAMLVRLRAEAGELPIIVLADETQEALALKTLQAGAQDYLLKAQLHGLLLARCVRHAVQRFRLLDELERHAHEWERTRRGDVAEPASVTAQMYGATSIRAIAHDVFDEMVATYTGVLDDAVDERAYRIEHNLPGRLRALADRLGFLRAGPRDVVEIHTEALRRRAVELSVRRFEAYQAEGRLMIIQLMGSLVSFYRRYSLAGLPRTVAAAADARMPGDASS
jgi:CheY-like chemotaxis protein